MKGTVCSWEEDGGREMRNLEMPPSEDRPLLLFIFRPADALFWASPVREAHHKTVCLCKTRDIRQKPTFDDDDNDDSDDNDGMNDDDIRIL